MTETHTVQEIERRFLVLDWDAERFHERLASKAGHKHILQGYMHSPEGKSRRIRITDGRSAELTQKTGDGLSRKEENLPLPSAECGIDLLNFLCDDRLNKRRIVEDGFEIDIYDGPLTGLVIIEKELLSEDDPVERPSWVKRWKEVTHSVSNQQLARLATELGRSNEPLRHEDLVAPAIPMIVLTGGPCSGKTTLMEALRKDPVYGSALHFVPEVATILISQVGIRPDPTEPKRFAHFQRTLYRVQRAFEELARLQALKDGKKAVLLDRGTMDSAAYLPEGVRTLEQLCETDAKNEYRRYHAIAVLATPSKDIYEQMKGNNSARHETYQEAFELGVRINAAWAGHASRHAAIGSDATVWEVKQQKVIDFLQRVVPL